MRQLLASALLFLVAVFARAAINPPDERTPFTAKELAQGYREHVILARPHAARRAAADAEETRDGIRVREKFARFGDLRIIDLDDSDAADTAIARLRASGRYEFVEPDYLRHISVEPNDPSFANGSLWGLKNTGLSNGIAGADIKAPQAWDIIREAPNVIVAVVDTGVNLNHQDLAANLWTNPAPTFGDLHGARSINGARSGTPTDDNGHGTHVAGTIGAIGDNSLAATGVAWRVQIMALKVFPASGSGSVSDIAYGINYAVSHGAHIINASYGESGSTGFSQTEFAAITAARNAGVIFVAAAGNAAANMDVSRFYPASHALDNIVTVGASGRRDDLAVFTNYGSAVDVYAPGFEILSLNYTTNTATTTKSGTSMAAPHVAGALALLKARYPTDTYRQLINRLMRGADFGILSDNFSGKAQGGARLNLYRALRTGDDDPLDGNRPFNDGFAARPRLAGDNLALRASNTGATAEPGEPAHAGSPATASLWWAWTAPTSGLVSVDTAGSAYDTVLAVYTGDSPSALALVASNDDTATATTSRVTFTAQTGVTYVFAVDGKGGATGLTLLNLGTTPANDLFATPVTLSGQSTQVTATNAHCTREIGEPRIVGFAGGTSLWYRWTAPRTGRFQVSVFSNDFDPLLGVYTGSTLASLTSVNESAGTSQTGPVCTVDAIAGTTYALAVDSRTAATVGQFTLSLTDSLWQAATTSNVTGAPAIGADGTLYIGSTDRSLYAFSADGASKWSFPTGGLIDTCSPAVGDDGTIYFGSNDGKLYAVTAAGTQKWAHDFGAGAPTSNSPAVAADGTLYVKAGDGYLYALNPADGSTKWRFNVNGPTTYASPSVAPDGTIYQGSEDKKLYALNPDGTLKWAFAGADNEIYSVPAIDAAGNIYFTVLVSGRLYSVTPGGTQRWVYSGTTLGSSSSPSLSPDGATVYFGGYDSKLHAVNAATGAARWAYPLGAEVRASSPAIDAAGVVYLGCYDNKLYAVNSDGTLKRTWDTANWIRSSPAISGSTLYVGSNDHKLYAFDLGASAGSGPWPQYRNNVRRLGRAIALAEPPVITLAPLSQAVVAGQPLTLRVTAAGSGPLAYQWSKDGAALAGATSSTYSVAAANAANAGSYTVRVTGPQGAVTSQAALVTVDPANPGRLINLSVRTLAGTGAQTLIVGFTMAGSPDKPVLIRAIGPSLTQFGVAGVLTDPLLKLFSGGTELATNDNWAAPDGNGGSAALAAAFAATGAFPLETSTKDAALVRTMAAGGFTAQVTSPAATGIALAELYDTAPAAGARLINVSARAQVGTGGDILIAGFTISGNVPKTVLIRGVGPSLAPFGVTGLLANPRLDLYRGPTLVQSNDDWAGDATLTTTFSQVGAFAFTGNGSLDAALRVTLAPGSYTAQISGVNNATGVALVEVYEVP